MSRMNGKKTHTHTHSCKTIFSGSNTGRSRVHKTKMRLKCVVQYTTLLLVYWFTVSVRLLRFRSVNAHFCALFVKRIVKDRTVVVLVSEDNVPMTFT